MAMQLYPHISADARVLAGQPVIEGTEVPVSLVVSAVAAGKSLSAVAKEHGVSVEDVRAALEYAARLAGEPAAVGGAGSDANSQDGDLLTPGGAEEARRLGLDPTTLSALGRRLLDQRARIRASGIPMLTWEQLDAEMDEQRGSEAE